MSSGEVEGDGNQLPDVADGTESDSGTESDGGTAGDNGTEGDAAPTCTCSTTDPCCDGCLPRDEGGRCESDSAAFARCVEGACTPTEDVVVLESDVDAHFEVDAALWALCDLGVDAVRERREGGPGERPEDSSL